MGLIYRTASPEFAFDARSFLRFPELPLQVLLKAIHHLGAAFHESDWGLKNPSSGTTIRKMASSVVETAAVLLADWPVIFSICVRRVRSEIERSLNDPISIQGSRRNLDPHLYILLHDPDLGFVKDVFEETVGSGWAELLKAQDEVAAEYSREIFEKIETFGAWGF